MYKRILKIVIVFFLLTATSVFCFDAERFAMSATNYLVPLPPKIKKPMQLVLDELEYQKLELVDDEVLPKEIDVYLKQIHAGELGVGGLIYLERDTSVFQSSRLTYTVFDDGVPGLIMRSEASDGIRTYYIRIHDGVDQVELTTVGDNYNDIITGVTERGILDQVFAPPNRRLDIPEAILDDPSIRNQARSALARMVMGDRYINPLLNVKLRAKKKFGVKGYLLKRSQRELEYYLARSVNDFFNAQKKDPSLRFRKLINSATGTGKTIYILKVFSLLYEAYKKGTLDHKPNAIVVYDGVELLDQLMDNTDKYCEAHNIDLERMKFFGSNGKGNGEGNGKKKVTRDEIRAGDGIIVFASRQNFHDEVSARGFDPEKFDLLVIDEAHHVNDAAKTFTDTILPRFKESMWLGTTATLIEDTVRLFRKTHKKTTIFGGKGNVVMYPYEVPANIRADYPAITEYLKEKAVEEGLIRERKFHLMFGEEVSIQDFYADLTKSKRIRYDENALKDFTGKVDIRDRMGAADFYPELYQMDPILYERVARLTERVAEFAPYQGLIFTTQIKHADKLSDLINIGLQVSGGKARVATYHSDLGPVKKKKVLRDFKNGTTVGLVVVGTFTEGIDYRKIVWIEDGSGGTSPIKYNQMQGRAGRPEEGFYACAIGVPDSSRMSPPAQRRLERAKKSGRLEDLRELLTGQGDTVVLSDEEIRKLKEQLAQGEWEQELVRRRKDVSRSLRYLVMGVMEMKQGDINDWYPKAKVGKEGNGHGYKNPYQSFVIACPENPTEETVNSPALLNFTAFVKENGVPIPESYRGKSADDSPAKVDLVKVVHDTTSVEVMRARIFRALQRQNYRFPTRTTVFTYPELARRLRIYLKLAGELDPDIFSRIALATRVSEAVLEDVRDGKMSDEMRDVERRSRKSARFTETVTSDNVIRVVLAGFDGEMAIPAVDLCEATSEKDMLKILFPARIDLEEFPDEIIEEGEVRVVVRTLKRVADEFLLDTRTGEFRQITDRDRARVIQDLLKEIYPQEDSQKLRKMAEAITNGEAELPPEVRDHVLPLIIKKVKHHGFKEPGTKRRRRSDIKRRSDPNRKVEVRYEYVYEKPDLVKTIEDAYQIEFKDAINGFVDLAREQISSDLIFSESSRVRLEYVDHPFTHSTVIVVRMNAEHPDGKVAHLVGLITMDQLEALKNEETGTRFFMEELSYDLDLSKVAQKAFALRRKKLQVDPLWDRLNKLTPKNYVPPMILWGDFIGIADIVDFITLDRSHAGVNEYLERIFDAESVSSEVSPYITKLFNDSIGLVYPYAGYKNVLISLSQETMRGYTYSIIEDIRAFEKIYNTSLEEFAIRFVASELGISEEEVMKDYIISANPVRERGSKKMDFIHIDYRPLLRSLEDLDKWTEDTVQVCRVDVGGGTTKKVKMFEERELQRLKNYRDYLDQQVIADINKILRVIGIMHDTACEMRARNSYLHELEVARAGTGFIIPAKLEVVDPFNDRNPAAAEKLAERIREEFKLTPKDLVGILGERVKDVSEKLVVKVDNQVAIHAVDHPHTHSTVIIMRVTGQDAESKEQVFMGLVTAEELKRISKGQEAGEVAFRKIVRMEQKYKERLNDYESRKRIEGADPLFDILMDMTPYGYEAPLGLWGQYICKQMDVNYTKYGDLLERHSKAFVKNSGTLVEGARGRSILAYEIFEVYIGLIHPWRALKNVIVPLQNNEELFRPADVKRFRRVAGMEPPEFAYDFLQARYLSPDVLDRTFVTVSIHRGERNPFMLIRTLPMVVRFEEIKSWNEKSLLKIRITLNDKNLQRIKSKKFDEIAVRGLGSDLPDEYANEVENAKNYERFFSAKNIEEMEEIMKEIREVYEEILANRKTNRYLYEMEEAKAAGSLDGRPGREKAKWKPRGTPRKHSRNPFAEHSCKDVF